MLAKLLKNKLKGLYCKYYADHGCKGDYASYEEAEVKCVGYDADNILNKVLKSTLMVKNGECAYERDGVAFFEKAINYNLMMYLYQIHKMEGRLHVCDFGGALGSTYWQHKELFAEMGNVEWNVVEQGNYILCGRANLENEVLHFYYNVKELLSSRGGQNVVLLSSVLQYFPEKDAVLDWIAELDAGYLIIERNPVGSRRRITIETVHEPIYESTRPFVCMDEKELVQNIENRGYQLLDSWKSLVDGDLYIGSEIYSYKSFVFKQIDE